jgi:general secretion pathway protein F
VREGAALSAALDSADAITPLVLGYLRAGERSGKLPAAIEKAAAELEREAETRARIQAALTYPAFLAVAGTVSVTAIVGLVVPRFAALLGSEGRALPPSTRMLVGAAELLHRGALPLLAVAIVAGAVLLRVLQTPEGQLGLHRRLLALPLLGPLRLRLATARVCGALASLFEAAVPMLAALDLARDAAADRAIAERIAAARQDVDRGEPLAVALRRHEALSPTALRLAAFGEQSGRLAVFLRHAARLESAATQRAIQRAVTLLEPLMILGMGAAVAFVAAALLQAVYSVRPGM